jgi:hypothetical protein
MLVFAVELKLDFRPTPMDYRIPRSVVLETLGLRGAGVAEDGSFGVGQNHLHTGRLNT